MTSTGWLTASAADVPAGDAWLSARERAVQAGLRVEKRRGDWRLGRWAAKAAVAAWLGVDRARIEVLAAPDGVPEAWLDGRPAPVSLSLSHRAGRALAAVTGLPATVGCDLEVVEPRSGPFVREWLTAGEQAVLAGLDVPARDVAANAMWAAKESAAKLRREGLRLDVRRAGADLRADGARWCPMTVRWGAGNVTAGWWRVDGQWVMTIAASPALAEPSPLPNGP
jgi:4'-phosphopantetheinyl transferase